MMTRRLGRRTGLAGPLLLVAAGCLWHFQGAFVAPKIPNLDRPERALRTAQFAESAESGEDSVEISGFSGFVVGLALLPYTCYALIAAFNVVRGDSFAFGPFGLELISCLVSVGLTLWSLGSFLQRGRGLPAGPLGLLGLSEGLSYLAALGLVLATVASGVRSGPKISLPPVPTISMPSMPKGDLFGDVGSAAPALKVPNVKLPDFKTPDFKVPDIKVPEIKIPDVKVPDIKVPDVPAFKAPKMPEMPDVKLPEVKIPKAPKPEAKPEEKKEEKKEAPPAPKKPEVKAPAKTETADFSSLFD